MGRMNAAEALESLRLKFASGNSVPVTRSQITREEYEALRDAATDKTTPPSLPNYSAGAR